MRWRQLPHHLCFLFFLMWFIATTSETSANEIFVDAGRGAVRVFVPSTYDPAEPLPLIMALHGYSGNGNGLEAYWRLEPLAEELGFIYLHPDGSRDFLGFQFWNATDACCDLFGSGIDDSAYLRALIDAVRSQLNVDENSIHIAGHSNGGFMSYRMACDHADIVASIASLAGATFLDPTDCTPSEPVHTLQIHGTSDATIFFGGGCIRNVCYPGAVETTETWAMYDGCAIIPDFSSPPLDLVANIPGSETDVTKYITDCLPGGSAELWTINGGVHVPNLSPQFGRLLVDHLLSHRRGSAPTIASFVDLQMITGGLLDGDLPELQASDDTWVHTRSGFGDTLIDLHHMEVQISATTITQTPSALDFTIESRIGEPAGTAQLRVLDHASGGFDLIAQYAIGATDAVELISNVNATNHVGPAGEIEVRLKHIVFVPFLAFTFESFIDHMEIVVQ